MSGQIIALLIFCGAATAIAAVGMFARDIALGLSGTLSGGSGNASRPIKLRRLARRNDTDISQGALDRFDSWFAQLVRETGWGLTPMAGTLFLGLCVLVAGGAMFLWTENLAATGIGGLIGALLAMVTLVVRRIRYVNRLQGQLPGLLEFLARSLRAGHSFDEAIRLVGEEGPKPLATEFQYCSRQLAMGLSLPAAVRSLADRVGIDDLRIFASLLGMHRQTGGNAAEILERFAFTIRDRMSYRRQLRAMTSAGRMSAFFVAALGPILFVYMFVFHGQYIETMLESQLGQTLLFAAAVLEAIGLIWTARLLKPLY